MKSCEEMVESLLSRREIYIQEQRRKRGTAVKTAAAALCIIAAAGLVIWRSGLNKTTKQLAVENSAVVIDKQDNNTNTVFNIPDTTQSAFSVTERITDIKSSISIDKIKGDNFTATMMIVDDPSRIFVGTTYPWTKYGQELDKIVGNYRAIAGINGGLYNLTANEGGKPYGLVVSNGEIQNISNLDMTGIMLIGMSEDNTLRIIDISGKKEDEIRQIISAYKIRDAVTYQEEISNDDHFVWLIGNGEKRELDSMGTGRDRDLRTAIGQTKDGRILLLVTTGRGVNGMLGAKASDLVEIMASYGAVNAANLDGGTSTSMYYRGEWLQNNVSSYYGMSWRIPTAILVK